MGGRVDYHIVSHYHYRGWHRHMCFVCGWLLGERGVIEIRKVLPFIFLTSLSIYYWNLMCVCVCGLVSVLCSMPKLWGGKGRPNRIPTSDIVYYSPILWVPDAHYLSLTTRYVCQLESNNGICMYLNQGYNFIRIRRNKPKRN